MIDKLLSFFADPSVDEVLINGTRSLIVQGATSFQHKSPFHSNDDLTDEIQKFVWAQKTRLDWRCPSAGGVLGEEWRWHAVIPPMAMEGSLFSLRRHRFTKISVDDFHNFSNHKISLVSAVQRGAHILICGPTGSGKTTFLHAFLIENNFNDRIIFLEQIPELPMYSPAWVRLQARGEDVEQLGKVGLETAIQEALRLRPDRFVIGELRNQEASAYLQAVASGHGNVFTTMHASSLIQAQQKLAMLMQTSVIKKQDLDLVFVFMERGQPPKITSVLSNT